MKIDNTILKRFITEFTDVLSEHSKELTKLDQAIGDGDHGLNMDRGFAAVAAIADEISALPLGEALKKMGMTLVMNVGGASGPLYGSLFMSMGKAVPAGTDPDSNSDISIEDLSTMLSAGIDAVKSRGKSDIGEKTMLEVLTPVLAALKSSPSDPATIIATVRTAADEGLASTKDMLATKGRASFLGERSIGHLDPGARSSALLVHTSCAIVESVGNIENIEKAERTEDLI